MMPSPTRALRYRRPTSMSPLTTGMLIMPRASRLSREKSRLGKTLSIRSRYNRGGTNPISAVAPMATSINDSERQ